MFLDSIRQSGARWMRLAAACAALCAGPAHAFIDGISAPGSTFALTADADYISVADGVSFYAWGYRVTGSAAPLMQFPGPTIVVNQGDTVTLTLTNNLPVNTSIIFPGQLDVSAVDPNAPDGIAVTDAGNVGKLAREAAPLGGTVSYRFVASRPGTFMYRSGTQMEVQQEMGLFGALIVRPAATNQAYEHPSTYFDRETLFVLSELDPLWRQAVYDQVMAANGAVLPNASIDTSAFGNYNPVYWFINGRNGPDTLAAAFLGTLPNQPYNCLPRMHANEHLLMRMVNAGRELHPFHHHGNNSWTIARDGNVLSSGDPVTVGPDIAQSNFTLQMVPGQTVDAIYWWSGYDLGWDVYGNALCGKAGQPACPAAQPGQLQADVGKPVPVKLPSELELTYGELYSGSPYLGSFGARPVGAGAQNLTAAYFHMFHSHNEREIINGGVYPGGMMTFVVIEPPSVPIQ